MSLVLILQKTVQVKREDDSALRTFYQSTILSLIFCLLYLPVFSCCLVSLLASLDCDVSLMQVNAFEWKLFRDEWMRRER